VMLPDWYGENPTMGRKEIKNKKRKPRDFAEQKDDTKMSSQYQRRTPTGNGML